MLGLGYRLASMASVLRRSGQGAESTSVVLTVGSQPEFTSPNEGYGFAAADPSAGYAATGSATPQTFLPSGSRLSLLNWQKVGTGSLNLYVEGEGANSGWETMTIGSYTFSRVDAQFFSAAGFRIWIFDPVPVNPFPAVGQDVTVSWL